MNNQPKILLASFVVFMGAASCSDDDDPAPPPPGTSSNAAPSFSGAASATVPENTTGNVLEIEFDDADDADDDITLMLSGPDAAFFVLEDDDGDEAEIDLETALDFEDPQDENADNVYEFTLTATDDEGASASVDIMVTITDVPEAFALSLVADGFSNLVQIVPAPTGPNLLAVEQGGIVRVLDPVTGVTNAVPFLDISGDVSSGSEQGLLGLAFSPDFATDRLIFVNLTNTSGDTEIRSYQTFTTAAEQVDPATENLILAIDQPFANHNAGWIGFGNDGFLLIPTGDGGSGGDPMGFAQNPASLLGKVLRIDVSGDDFPGDDTRDYAIPPGNAFPGGVGGASEIFALGLRNPFRASIDVPTGDLYIGDVGQDLIEEVSRISSGQSGLNFGWNLREGAEAFNGGADSPDFTPPLLDYDHGTGPFQGNSVVGGVVYRGPIADLDETYVFGDTITANIWAVSLTDLVDGTSQDTSVFVRLNDSFSDSAGTIDLPTSFAVDSSGNLLITDLDGEVFAIVPSP
ncbi:MAG: PQQ-dependent sugar dehydrogenase [Pseudomonadota bacterium]